MILNEKQILFSLENTIHQQIRELMKIHETSLTFTKINKQILKIRKLMKTSENKIKSYVPNTRRIIHHNK